MKKTKKLMAIVLTTIMLLSTAPLFASAAGIKYAPDFANSQSTKECSVFDDEELKIDKVVRVQLNDTVNFATIKNADYTEALYVGDTYCVDFNYDESTYDCESFTAIDYGVTVVTVVGYTESLEEEDGEEFWYYEKCGEYTWAIVVVDPEGMGEVTDITAFDETFRYKETYDMSNGYFTWAYPYIETKNDEFAYFTTIYASENYQYSPIYLDGMVDTGAVSSTACTVYVVDAAGHVFRDTCTITVKYSWWQQLIRIFLLGFLWY